MVEDYVSALDDDDREAANDLIHPDAEEGEIPEDEWEFMQQFFDSVDVEILDVDEDDDEATVEAEVTFEYDDESESDEEEFELRTHDDEWLIYDD
ncbi:hypothetical protein C493_16339 [Natronolimnohabitans innermongolicus JCM 12255]|uniref:DUF4878 domain-containing protein n=1 Tax=Natronolimnohabitans innermongolicus JCM 12255 TaxID=1227499 RepID=L9WRW6_9EURY|nr:hypothetical protein C493_16339 [Natronolimnohabitans innermongolicus JCM 12255]